MMNFFSIPTTAAKTTIDCKNAAASKNSSGKDDEYDIKSEERYSNSSQIPTSSINHRDDSSTTTMDMTAPMIDLPSPKGPVVSSSEPTKLFSYVHKRNWAAAVKRCKSEEYATEARTWVVENNRDNSIRWKLLPIHQVNLRFALCLFSVSKHIQN